MPQLNFPAPGATDAVQHITSFGGFDVTPVFTYRYTNILVWSEDLTNTTWYNRSGNVYSTATLDSVNNYLYDSEPVSPLGIQISKNRDNTFRAYISANNYSWGQRLQVDPSTTYTLSWYAKRVTAANVHYRLVDFTVSANIINATNYSANINANTFSRMSVTFTTGSLCRTLEVYLLDSTVPTSIGSIDIYGPQLELGSTATEYNSTQANSYAILGLTSLSSGNVKTVTGGLTDYLDLTYDFPPIINILGVSTITYETAKFFTDDLDLLSTNVTTSSSKVIYIPEQSSPPFTAGENIRLTDSISGIVKVYTVAACTTRTVTINTEDAISEKFVILAKTISAVYTQDKIINDFRTTPFVGSTSSPRTNYYVSTYFGIPYRAQQILGTDKPNYSFVDARPVDNKFAQPLAASFVSFAQRNQFVIKGVPDQSLLPTFIDRRLFQLRTITAVEQLKFGAFSSSSIYVFKEPGTGRRLLQTFLDRAKTLPLRPDISWVSTNPMGFGVRAIFRQEQDVTDLSLNRRNFVNLEIKLRENPINLSKPAQIEPAKFTGFKTGLEKDLGTTAKINAILPRFLAPTVDKRDSSFLSFVQPQIVRRIHEIFQNPTFAQLERDRTKLLPADRTNIFHKVEDVRLTIKPENVAGLPVELLLDNVNLLEKRLITSFQVLTDIENLRTNFAKLDSNVVVTVTRNNMSNVTTLTSKTSYTAAERYLIDLLKPVYKTQFVNTNFNLSVDELQGNVQFLVQGQVIPKVGADRYVSGDRNFTVNLLQKQIFVLRTDTDSTLRNTARLIRKAMANVAMPISSHIEKTYNIPMKLSVPTRFSVPVDELLFARVNRAFINYKFTHSVLSNPARFSYGVRVISTPDSLQTTANIARISNINPAFNKFYVVNDQPLRESTASLRKYVNEGIVQPPMKVIGQYNLGNDVAELYLDDNDILRTGLKFVPTISPISVTANDVVPFKILAGPTAAANIGNNVTVTIRKKADTNDFYSPGYLAETWINVGNVTLEANGTYVDSAATWANVGVATFEVTFPYGNYVVTGPNVYQNRLTQQITVTSQAAQTLEALPATVQSITIDPVIRVESPAVYFDGYQDFIESSSSAMLGFGATPTTIEMMIRPMSISPLQVITSFWSNTSFNYADKLDIYLNSQLQVCLGQVFPRSLDIFSPLQGAYERELFCRTVNPLTTSALTHLAIVLQNNSVNIYFNGVQQTLVGSSLIAGPNGSVQFRIGHAGTTQPSFVFVGNI